MKSKGRLQPGKMFLVDTVEGRIIADKEIKKRLCRAAALCEWLKANQITHRPAAGARASSRCDHETILSRQRAFGYTYEDLKMIMEPMATKGPGAGRLDGNRYAAGLPFRPSRSRCSITSSSCLRR